MRIISNIMMDFMVEVNLRLLYCTRLKDSIFVGCLSLSRMPNHPGVMRCWQDGLTDNLSCQHTHMHTYTNMTRTQSRGFAAAALPSPKGCLTNCGRDTCSSCHTHMLYSHSSCKNSYSTPSPWAMISLHHVKQCRTAALYTYLLCQCVWGRRVSAACVCQKHNTLRANQGQWSICHTLAIN